MSSGCAAEECEQLCTDTARAIAACLPEWNTDWSALGASSQRDFRTQCQSDWESVRTDLEPRQIESANDRCQDAVDDLADDRFSCDELRALYL